MNVRDFSKIGMVMLLCGGMLFAGCAKKKVAMPGAGNDGSSVSQQDGSNNPSVNGVRGGALGKTLDSSASSALSHSVYFPFNSANLSGVARSILDANAAWLNSHTGKRVTIEGNCDERGDREYNLALGQRRADGVRQYLIRQGVAGNRMTTVSFGEERPVCRSSGESCWAKNRHADFSIH